MKKKFTLFMLVAFIVLGTFVYSAMGKAEKSNLNKLNIAKITQELRDKGYLIGVVSFAPNDKNELNIELSKEQTNISEAEKFIKNYLDRELSAKNLNNITVTIETKNIEHKTNKDEWFLIGSEVDNKLKSISDRYTGLALDLNPLPVTYILKSNFSQKDIDPSKLEHWVEETNNIIIENDLPSLLQENEVYVIKVRGKDNKILYSKEFE
ncbi:MAG: hypothetical protein ACQEUT_08245 [Bacillota bacterium]